MFIIATNGSFMCRAFILSVGFCYLWFFCYKFFISNKNM